MSQENVRIVERIYEAYARGDTSALLAAVDPGIRFYDRADRPGATVYEGHDGLLQFARSDREVFDNMRYEPVEFIAAGDYVLVRNRQTGRGKASGLPVEDEIVNAWKLRGGAPVEMRVFSTEREAREALGLGPRTV